MKHPKLINKIVRTVTAGKTLETMPMSSGERKLFNSWIRLGNIYMGTDKRLKVEGQFWMFLCNLVYIQYSKKHGLDEEE